MQLLNRNLEDSQGNYKNPHSGDKPVPVKQDTAKVMFETHYNVSPKVHFHSTNVTSFQATKHVVLSIIQSFPGKFIQWVRPFSTLKPSWPHQFCSRPDSNSLLPSLPRLTSFWLGCVLSSIFHQLWLASGHTLFLCIRKSGDTTSVD